MAAAISTAFSRRSRPMAPGCVTARILAAMATTPWKDWSPQVEESTPPAFLHPQTLSRSDRKSSEDMGAAAMMQ